MLKYQTVRLKYRGILMTDRQKTPDRMNRVFPESLILLVSMTVLIILAGVSANLVFSSSSMGSQFIPTTNMVLPSNKFVLPDFSISSPEASSRLNQLESNPHSSFIAHESDGTSHLFLANHSDEVAEANRLRIGNRIQIKSDNLLTSSTFVVTAIASSSSKDFGYSLTGQPSILYKTKNAYHFIILRPVDNPVSGITVGW